ncbi:MAG: hypothetical protein H5U24_20050 [Thioclava marina]|uniref:Uncharacterized protein n=1 Tax=Thioclava marina TaxID=1915077 RepID=A0ABX3MR14_9RHOB|nr:MULTISPECIES: hypothetical protein [Thioclava]TNE89748.1 MAG: hypothetical protein EP337_08605 [Paracoccaceae bacterium]MBC7147660.1 hypothetical protein [Thioclava marina]OOY13978.1 hypothetical protein BMG00_09580 [Thioclava marina]OOY29683.1 hypothetical protein BMI90_05500 [Thioclava sp. L04-15]TNF14684.1 MAG: hypothetical protein EP320_06435 [Paracoccaceae bacterium]
MSFKTKATALFTATTVALGTMAASTTPAAALGDKDRDTLAVLLGIGAAALIIDSMNDDKKKRKTVPPSVYLPRETWKQRESRLERERIERERREAEARRERERERERDRYGRDRIHLPSSCVQKVKTRNGWGEVVSADCLDRYTRTRLPRNCAFTIKTGRHDSETVYGRNCLEDQGIRLSRR